MPTNTMPFRTMKLRNWMTLAAGALVIAACDGSKATAPDTSLDADFDTVDPVVAMFNSTYGLPEGPFVTANAMPFTGGLGLPPGQGIQRPTTFGAAAGVGAPLPDSLKLSDAQKAQIQSLVNAFQVANKADLDLMIAVSVRARVAHRAGKTKAEVKAILDEAKPAAERVRANAEILRTAIQGVLTPAQKAWIDARRPTNPFRMQ